MQIFPPKNVGASAAAMAFALFATPSTAEMAFGTEEEAKALATELVSVIDEQGVGSAAQAVNDPTGVFRSSPMGINLFQGSLLIADNREPESIAQDYSMVEDLTGEPIWDRIVAAADQNTDAVLYWYHYDTQEEYTFHCFSMHATRDDGLVMVCR